MSSNLDRHVAALAADPADRQAFEILEEAYFLAGDWDKLVAAYRQRLLDPGLVDPQERAPLQYRLGQILEERCLDIDLAVVEYTQAVQLDPGCGPALRQLRQVHTNREAWDMVLQIAEVELATLSEPYEQAVFFAEMGDVWLRRLRDANEAMACFEQALAIDPNQKEALAGLARTLEAQSNPEAAAATWERMIATVRGPDRAAPLVALAGLLSGPLHQSERAVELYRRALGDDPRNEAAVEALSISAAARGQWDLLTDLFERRFSLAAGARRRTAIALEAGYMQLEQMHNVEAARVWFKRAEEMSADDKTVIAAFIDLEREAGNDDALARALDRVIDSNGNTTPLRYLLEAAGLHTERADDERALACLELAERQSPDDSLVLESLCAAYQNLQRHDDLASALERRASLVEADPEEHVTLLIELGYVQATQLGDVEAAQDAYEGAFKVCPSRTGLATTLEGLYRKTESWQRLRAVLEQAADAGPESERSGFACSLGQLLEEKFEDPGAAAACYEASLDSGPSPRALQGLSRLAERSGDPSAMQRALEREAEVVTDPGRLAEVCLDLCRRHEQLGDSEAALTWANRLIAARPDSREGLEAAARAQEKLERYDELTRTLTALDYLLRGAEQAEVRRRIAKLHASRGENETALTWWEAALEIEPDDLQALTSVREHYLAQNRFEDLAPILRRLADASPVEAQATYLDELARLLDEQLCDVDAAIVVLWRLTEMAGRPDDARDRLEHLLERAGRFEELAQQLLERRRALPDDSEETIDLDLRRAQLMLDPLGQFEDAVTTFRAVRLRAPQREDATRGLERALRASNDSAGLAHLLDELATTSSDPERRQELLFERAVLLEESLEELEQARQAYTRLCTPKISPAMAERAGSRLENLLERCGDWPALRVRLESRAAAAEGAEELALRERAAHLCLDRMDDPEGAIVNLEAAAQVDPSRSHPWGSLATIYQDLSRPDDLLRVTCAELETAPGPERELVLHARAAALWIERDGEQDRACSHFERLLELEPGRADATEFLVDRYEEQGRYADVVRLLEDRLGTICGAEGEEACDDASRGLVSSLRLRMATLQAEELNDPEAAIVLLEAAMAGDGPTGAATEPLAELYESTERRRDLVDLCKAAAEACRASDERALWLRRMASSLHEMGEDDDAIEAYRQVLEARPNDLEVRKELCDLYRRGDHAAPLVELLTDSLSGISSVEEVPIRMELARLLEDGLSRPAEALAQLQRVFELEADHDVAFRQAVDLAHRMGRHDTEAQLVENRLERCTSRDERIALLERRAGLLAGPLGAPEAAASAYREVISLAPQNRSARRSLREVLESLGRWAAVLDCLYVDAEGAGPQEQAAIYEHAAEIATAHVGQDAALPWLERLRSVRPDDALIIARIADVHRMAGRFESVLRALEDELALTRDPRHQRDLHVGRARILERDMDAPGRAIRALEAARALFPQDSEVLEKLDELYGVTARARERAEVIEARLPGCSDDDRLRMHLAAADLYADPLTEPLRAVPHLLRAVSLTGAGEGATQAALPSTPEARCALLSDLASTLGAAGWQEARARAAEAELSLLRNDLSERGPEEDDPRVTRRNRLHLDLARAYADQLANPNAAMAHLRADMAYADEDDSAGLRPEDLDWMESRLLDLLRQDANFVELEERLATRVGRGGGDADEWLELARLRDERLCSPSAARDAYAQALALRSSCLPAIRGLRDLSERLGDWREVARTLELQLQLEGSSNRDRDDLERAALSRRLGDVCWRRIHAEDRAIEAYRDALASNPTDLDSLRSLQQLHESREEFDAAAGLHEREAKILGDSEPERRREVWLSAAELVRKLGDDPQRALHAYEEAASLSPLDAQPLRVQADLYAELGRHSDFAATYASWCDLDESGATCGEHLLLVDTLIELGRPDDAIARCQHAIEVDGESPDAWATLAQLQQDQDHDGEAGDAWQRAGELRQGPEAATHLCTAALLVETSDRDLCAERLRSALERDPASAQGHAHLARVACALAKWAEAEDAAVRALDLAAAPSDENVDEALQLATALAGGRAARALDRLESAVLFYGAALDLDPANRDALEAYGELLFERGDLAAARGALEARLEMDPDDRQAERLAMLGSVLELVDEPEDALARFREAIAADETCGAAQAGVARLCANAGHVHEAVEALAGWAEACRSADDLRGCGARYLRAADLELSQEGAEAARAHLHASIEAYPENARAWVLLAELHAEADQLEDVLRLAPEALGVDAVQALPDAVARLSLLYARALERRDEPAKACDAYSIAVDHDSRCTEAALARARLQRMQGEWQEAADGLRAFSDRHPEPDHRDLSEIQYKLARLLAGPLEDMAGAIRCFERALEIAPDHPKARGPLASLLAVMPERWEQAIAQHAALLQDDPTQATSLRGLLKIVRSRGDTEAAGPGLAVLRALGAASPSERDEAPGCLPAAVVVTPALADPAEELARRLIQHASEALDQVLQTPSGDDPSGTAEGFVARRDHALRELSAAGLERFSDEELGDLIAILAAFAMGDGEDVHMSHGQLDPSVAEGIDRALGRWTRRKMRRVLDGGSPEQIQMIDPGHFRRALRGLAAAVAVDLGHGDLREALVALSIDRDAPAPSDTDDLTNPVSACGDACELLRYVTTSWCAQLVGS